LHCLSKDNADNEHVYRILFVHIYPIRRSLYVAKTRDTQKKYIEFRNMYQRMIHIHDKIHRDLLRSNDQL